MINKAPIGHGEIDARKRPMMRIVLLAVLLGAACFTTVFAQEDVYLCENPNAPGGREFKNVGNVSGCKKVALPSSEPAIGMTHEAVTKMLGLPVRVKYLKTRAGKTEKWFYGGGKTLTFKNGLLEVVEQE